jgi:hypothetical protein
MWGGRCSSEVHVMEAGASGGGAGAPAREGPGREAQRKGVPLPGGGG